MPRAVSLVSDHFDMEKDDTVCRQCEKLQKNKQENIESAVIIPTIKFNNLNSIEMHCIKQV